MNKFINVELGGKRRTIWFTIGPVGELVEFIDLSLNDLLPAVLKNPYKYVPLIIYFGAAHDDIRKGNKEDFDLHQVADWIEALPGGIDDQVIVDIIRVFIRSNYKDVPQSEESDQDQEGQEDEKKTMSPEKSTLAET